MRICSPNRAKLPRMTIFAWLLRATSSAVSAFRPHAFAYVIDGSGAVGPNATPAGEGQLAVFARDGESVQLANPAGAKAAFNLLLIGGAPLGEPVARYGPFVMNTQAELYQAFEDFRSGRMGEIVAH